MCGQPLLTENPGPGVLQLPNRVFIYFFCFHTTMGGMELEHSLHQKQIVAAQKIREKLQGRDNSYKALTALSDKFPGFEAQDCLLKSVAVNSIYGTNIRAIVRVSNHVAKVFGKHKDDLDHIDPAILVEQLAIDEGEGEGRKRRTNTSFVSKFCHFLYPPTDFQSMTTRLVRLWDYTLKEESKNIITGTSVGVLSN